MYFSIDELNRAHPGPCGTDAQYARWKAVAAAYKQQVLHGAVLTNLDIADARRKAATVATTHQERGRLRRDADAHYAEAARLCATVGA